MLRERLTGSWGRCAIWAWGHRLLAGVTPSGGLDVFSGTMSPFGPTLGVTGRCDRTPGTSIALSSSGSCRGSAADPRFCWIPVTFTGHGSRFLIPTARRPPPCPGGFPASGRAFAWPSAGADTDVRFPANPAPGIVLRCGRKARPTCREIERLEPK